METSFWDQSPSQWGRAFLYAVIVHIVLALGFLAVKQSEPDITPGESIPVTVIFDTITAAPAPKPEDNSPAPKPAPQTLAPAPPTKAVQENPPTFHDDLPAEKDIRDKEKDTEPSPTPKETETAPVTATIIISEAPSSETSRSKTSSDAPLKPGSRWALNPPLSTENLSGLGMLKADIECLQSLSSECTALRKEVFAEYQMSETDKVWSPQYAHSGLPSDFYGLSEREIRQKLGLHFAGENGLYIPFTNIGLNGGIWDKMHGVNKGCKSKIGRTSAMEGGRQIMIKDCPSYQEGSKNGP